MTTVPTADPAVLFEPIEIGPRTTRNRIVLPPNGANITNDGLYNEGVVAYYGEVAARTAGLIVTGASVVHPSSAMPKLQRIYDPANGPWLGKLAETVHRSETLLVCQLMHLGSHLGPIQGQPYWMPSPVPSEWSPDIVREMTLDEIAELKDSFVSCAGILVDCGWDGVELHATHGYLLQEFHSPHTNHRTDQYGGTAFGREQLLFEILQEWRDMPNPPSIVGMRISGGELRTNGLQWSDVLNTCERMGAQGLLDYVSLTIPTPDEYVKDAAYPLGGLAPMSAALRSRVTVPVVVSQRIRGPEIAAGIVASGQADLVALGRGLVADPAWGEKAASGRSHHIRPCIACMEDCRTEGPYSGSRTVYSGGYGCILNPHAYLAPSAPSHTTVGLRVVVVGAGPAGAEAAIAAADAGAKAVVLERGPSAGGRTRLAGSAPNRTDWAAYADYLDATLADRPDIELHFGTEADVDVLRALRPAMVIVATGSVPVAVPPYLGPGAVHTESFLTSCLTAPPDPSRPWLVVDDVGRWDALSSVEKLTSAGCEVVYATRFEVFGPRIPPESRTDVLRRFTAAGVRVVRLLTDVTVSGTGVTITTSDGRTVESPDVGVIVWGGAMRTESLHDVWSAEVGVPMWAIGDSLSPRGLSLATKEGASIGRRVVEWQRARDAPTSVSLPHPRPADGGRS